MESIAERWERKRVFVLAWSSVSSEQSSPSWYMRITAECTDPKSHHHQGLASKNQRGPLPTSTRSANYDENRSERLPLLLFNTVHNEHPGSEVLSRTISPGEMALTIALPLSGLEPEHFCALGARLLYEQGLRTLTGSGPISPSTGSESSGVSSLTPSVESATPELTPISSRPDTPAEESCKRHEKANQPLRVFYKDRDILNLGANIREPFWQMRNPSMPRYDFRAFMANRSVYYRLGEYALTEEYPTRICKDCGFCEPSPYLF